jgi:diguanylate cyclase
MDSNNNDRFAHAEDCGKRSLALLLKERIPPIPPHYAVGYAYFDHTPQEVYEVLQERLSQGHALDEDLLLALYERYLLPDGYERFRSVRTDLERLLKFLLKSLRQSDAHNDAYLNALERHLQALDQATSSEDLRAIGAALIAATREVQVHNQALAAELRQARDELKKAHTELEQHRKAALIDPLTGLYNRRAMQDILQELWAGPPPLTMLVADIDHFKKINDTYGHQIGDVVIRQVAEVLRKCIRGEDYAVRYGGEEFVVLLPDTDLAGGRQVAEHIRSRVAKLRLVRKHDNLVIDAFTISIGIAERRPDDNPDSLFQRADSAMYVSKSTGRNRVTAEV